MIFGVRLDNCEKSRDFIRGTSERFVEPSVLNPFSSYKDVKYFKNEDLIYIFSTRVIYPAFYTFTPYMALIGLILFLLLPDTWFFYPFVIGGGLLYLTKFFFSTNFMFYTLKRGLKKIQYNGKIERIEDEDIIIRLIEDKGDYRGAK